MSYEDLFILGQQLCESGMNLTFTRRRRGDENAIVLKVSQFGFSDKQADPRRGVKTGKKKIKSASDQNEHKEGEYYTPEEILPLVVRDTNSNKKKGLTKAKLGEDYVNVCSLRLLTFKEKGCTCSYCGLEGTVFLKDRHLPDMPWHLNLYGEKDGELILITKDHIIPKSKGGPENLDNMQPMCIQCNNKKGNGE